MTHTLVPGAASAEPSLTTTSDIVLENPRFRWVLTPAGRNRAFIDRATGTNHLRPGEPSLCASVRRDGREFPVTTVTLNDGHLRLAFGDAAVDADLRVSVEAASIVLTLESVRGDADAVTFVQVPLALAGRPEEPFGACALALNLITRVDALPVLQRDLRASAERRFGWVGARVALVAGPPSAMLPALRETLENASELPVCRVAGPWAHDIPFNHGSYLFNFGALTETNVSDWIEATRRVGFTQIDHHGGGAFFRFGDFELNREKWPEGWETFRRLVGRLKEAGIGSIFHTYAFFIDKASKYVTPVPDARLDAFRVFTLAEPLTAEATEITVNEPTTGMTTVTGFFEHNSVLLHLGDELVTFSGVSASPPWRFTGIRRGAHGTTASPHAQGARARHLKECFGLLVPDPESTLFTEIAARHAEIVDHCGFEGIYLDAIDGSSILRGPEELWYWANAFVVEIQKRLRRPVGMEMSAMWHHFWQYRTRWQAWDLPQRGHKRFLDEHAAQVNGALMLPLHLGWWGFQAFQPPQIEPTYPEVMETLGARLVGWNAGISLTAGIDRDALRRTPLFQRAADILRTSETLRHSGTVDAPTRARLRDPGQDFALVSGADGRPRFAPRRAHAQTLATDAPWTRSWTVTNPFAAQPLRFRLEALMSAGTAGDTPPRVLADLGGEPAERWHHRTAEGVNIVASPEAVPAGLLAELSVTNAGRVPRHAAWARWEKRFDPPLAAPDDQALGVEIEGDGSGAVLAFRLESPRHLRHGAIADRYVTLDFTDRRRVTLVETESSRWSDYVWNDGKHLYHAYRETIDFGALESLSVWLQNLPPGRTTRIGVGPITALPLQPTVVAHPSLTLGGQTLHLRIRLEPGSWIEALGPEDCLAYDAKGKALGKVDWEGSWPHVPPGTHRVRFDVAEAGVPAARARVTVFHLDAPLELTGSPPSRAAP